MKHWGGVPRALVVQQGLPNQRVRDPTHRTGARVCRERHGVSLKI